MVGTSLKNQNQLGFIKMKAETLLRSPVCKHLGCTVNWNSDKAHPNQFFCPCHGVVIQKMGLTLKVRHLAPLDVYESKVKDGTLYLGKAKPRGCKVDVK